MSQEGFYIEERVDIAHEYRKRFKALKRGILITPPCGYKEDSFIIPININ